MRASRRHATPRPTNEQVGHTPERATGSILGNILGRNGQAATLPGGKHELKRRSAVVFAIALLMSLAGIVAPISQPEAAAEGKQIPPTMMILDASGSMMARDAGGETRLDAAKAASKDFSRSVADDSELGFMVYGTKVGNSPEEREAGCKDVTTLLPVREGNASKIPGEVDKVKASGHTPMGPALKKAAEELPDEGERSIVLVSDGEDTCAPPPVCDVAKDLHEQGIDLTINTVGFLVDPAAKKELECIAKAGGGEYMDAKDTESLSESMKVLATRSAKTTDSSAEEIMGGDDGGSATEVPEDVEIFSTKLREKKSEDSEDEDGAEYFSTPIAKGERLVISVATMQPPSQGVELGYGSNFGVAVKELGYSCRQSVDTDHGVIDSNGPFFASMMTKPAGKDCPPGPFRFRINRESGPYEGKDIPAEVKITRFKNENIDDVPEPFGHDEKLDMKPPAPDSKARKVTPGTWFDDATELDPNSKSTVHAEIVPGETHVYKIKSEYGQQLYGGISSLDAPEADDPGQLRELEVKLLNSARQRASTDSRAFVKEGGKPEFFGNETRLNYRNAVGEGENAPDDPWAEKNWLDGEQYIVVFFNNSWRSGETKDLSKAKNAAATYELTTELKGEKIPGPTFGKVSHDSDLEEKGSESTEAEVDEAAAAQEPEDDGPALLFGMVIGMVLMTIVILFVRKKWREHKKRKQVW